MMNTKGLEKPEDGYGIEDYGGTTILMVAELKFISTNVLTGVVSMSSIWRVRILPHSAHSMDSHLTRDMNEIKRFSEVTEGCVMIFPSFMQHYADVSQGNRIIVSFDITYNKKRIPLNIWHRNLIKYH